MGSGGGRGGQSVRAWRRGLPLLVRTAGSEDRLMIPTAHGAHMREVAARRPARAVACLRAVPLSTKRRLRSGGAARRAGASGRARARARARARTRGWSGALCVGLVGVSSVTIVSAHRNEMGKQRTADSKQRTAISTCHHHRSCGCRVGRTGPVSEPPPRQSSTTHRNS